MEKQTLKNANELNQQLDKLDRFIYGCKQSWKNIFIPVQKRSKSLKIKYHEYGYVNSAEFDCGKELSNRIFDVIEQYYDEKKKEFEELK